MKLVEDEIIDVSVARNVEEGTEHLYRPPVVSSE